VEFSERVANRGQRRETPETHGKGNSIVSRFTLSRSTAFWNIAAVLAVGALSFGAYLSIPKDGESLGTGIPARGTIESIDAAMRVIRISHDPVKALGTQAVKMDFGVAPNVDVGSLRVGSKVAFTLIRREGELYIVDAIRPTM
jgi:Cu/Ag efflux protein CusF